MNEQNIENVIQRLERLEKAVFGREGIDPSQDQQSYARREIDFALNPRKFANTYAKGLNGEKKFTLLVAFLSKGKLEIEVEVSAVEDLWNKMKSKDLMGTGYNGKYPTGAKTQGWVDSKNTGSYYLVQGWTAIFD